MTPERWQQVDSILQAALDLAPEYRSAFLDKTCAGDESLRREVEDLISSLGQAGSFIESPAIEATARLVAPDEVQPLATQSLAHYRVVEQLGVGGMGEVFLARDTKLGRKVALKVLPAHFTEDTNRLRRFQQEASTASALNHPNIVTIYEIGSDQGRHFIATEFIDGETVRERMNTERLSLADTLEIAAQVAAALEAAHEAGIAHRDIKPENIMIRRRDRIVKVLDFGLAKLTEKSANKQSTDSDVATRALVRTMAGVLMGTTYYMSPEQARGRHTDERTDIWSLGVVLYEMLSGSRPFNGETPEDVRASILRDDPQPLPQIIPEPIRAVAEKALRKNKDERYQTTGEMLADLRDLQSQAFDFRTQPEQASAARLTAEPPADVNTAVAPVVPTQPAASSAEYLVNEIKRHRGVTLAVLAAIVLVVAAILYFRTNAGKTDTERSISSIAVVPFANANGDSNAEYFSDGITESIINSLSQLPRMKVLARTTVFRYKGREAETQRIGKELGVDALLTGRVLKQGDTMTIQVDLVRVADGTQLWGDRYNRKLTDIFSVQNEIANEIASKLRLTLSGEEQKRITKRYTDNVEAYQLFLKGRFEAHKFTREGLAKGIEYYNQAIAIDPTYALAYAGLSQVYSMQTHAWVPPPEGYAKAKWAAEKALALDDTLAEAHSALGAVQLYYDWNFPAAESEFKRAIELNPNYAGAYSNYSGYFKAMRRYPEEISQARRGQELDPLSAFANMELGEALYHGRRYDEAIEQIRKTLELDPHFFIAYHVRARAYEQKKMYSEAIADCQEWERVFPGDPIALASLGHVYGIMGKRREAEDVVNKLLEIAKQRYFSAYWIAVAYAGLGDNDQAFRYFEKAFEERYFIMIWMNSDPRLDNLRSDPRFADLVKRIGL